MITLNNLLKFIELKKYSVREFEAGAGLSNGTFNAAIKRNVDLSDGNIKKIVEKYSKELEEAGFIVTDLRAFGRDGYVILEPKSLVGKEVSPLHS